MYLSNQVTGGYTVLQHHDPRYSVGSRMARYACRVYDTGPDKEWVIEDNTIGDVVGARHWENRSVREISAWSYAMPVLTGTTPDPRRYANQDAMGGAAGPAGAAGAVGAPGLGANSALYRPPIGPDELSNYNLARFGYADIGSAAFTSGAYFWRWTDGYSHNSGGGLSPAQSGTYRDVPIWGGRNDFSRFGPTAIDAQTRRIRDANGASPNGDVAAGQVGAWFGFAAPGNKPDDGQIRYVDVTPIRKDWTKDDRFVPQEQELPRYWPAFPVGYAGIALAGTEETKQAPVWLPTDPRLIAVNTAPDPICGTLVCDLEPANTIATGGLQNSPGTAGRTARLQSIFRVLKMPSKLGSLPKGNGNGIALQFTSSELDGLAGYGLAYGVTVGKQQVSSSTTQTNQGQTTAPDGPMSNPQNNKNIVNWTPSDFGAQLNQSVIRTSGAGNTGLSGAQLENARDTAANRPVGVYNITSSQSGGDPVVMLLAEEAGGPLSVGSAGDKHELGKTGDGVPINSAHISTSALFHSSAERDAPLEFCGYPYPKPKTFDDLSMVFLSYDPKATHTDYAGKSQPGLWKWWTTVPHMEEGGFPPPTPTPPTTNPPGGGPPGNPPPPPGQPPGPGGGPTTTPGGGTPGNPGSGDPPAVGPGSGRPGTGRGGDPGLPLPGPEGGGGGGGGGKRFMLQYPNGSGTWDTSISYVRNVSAPAIVFKPNSHAPGATDYRNSRGVNPDELEAERHIRPAVLRIESWGAVTASGDWKYTEKPDAGRSWSGTANGGVNVSPAPLDIMDKGDSYAPTGRTIPTAYWNNVPGMYMSFGVPADDGDLSNDSWRYAYDTGDLVYETKRAGTWVETGRWTDDGTYSIFKPDHLQLQDPEYEDLVVPLEAGAGAPDKAKITDNGSGSTGIFRWAFDPDTEEYLDFVAALPHSWVEGTNITPHVRWSPSDASGNTVVWGIEYAWANVDANFGNSTLVTSSDAGSGTAKDHLVCEFSDISGTGKTISSVIIGRLYRDATNLSDDYGADAYLLGLSFRVQVNTLGSKQTETK